MVNDSYSSGNWLEDSYLSLPSLLGVYFPTYIPSLF